MQITIRGHHLTITPAIEENIRLKFAEMTKHLDQVNSMQVKLTKDHQVDKRSKKVVIIILRKRLYDYLGQNFLHKRALMICIPRSKNCLKN